MFKGRISIYVLTLLALVVLIVVFSVQDDKKDKRKLDSSIFSISDTASINRVVLTSPEFEHLLTRDQKNWTINSSYKVDPVVREVMLSLMHNIRVKRPVAKAEQVEVINLLKSNGVEVEVFSGEKLMKSYYVGGRPNENLTYFMDKNTEEAYVVFLPGYKSYIASFFEMEENNWKERAIFNSSWMGIKKFQLKYGKSSDEGFDLVYDKNFFKIPGIVHFDTAAIMEYLDMFRYFEADAYVISSEVEQYKEHLKEAPELMNILLQDVNSAKSREVSFYEHPQDGYFYIAKVKGKEEETLVLVNKNKMKALSKKRSDFTKNNSNDL